MQDYNKTNLEVLNICRSTYLVHKIMDLGLMLKIFNFIFPKVCRNFVLRTLDVISSPAGD